MPMSARGFGREAAGREGTGTRVGRLARALLRLCTRRACLLVGALWFALVLCVTLWTWGYKPVVFTTGDEATNQYAASMLRQTGHAFARLPHADPEDLLHLRPWRSIGDRAVPFFPPLAFYLYALLLRFGDAGHLLISALPATGGAAFAAGTARLLPQGRRWLAVLAPALGFPALYWLMRPWMNISLLLVALCWALFFWSRWRENERNGWLAAALMSVGLAAAIRPDYAAFVLSAATLLALAASPQRWRAIGLFALSAGAGAFGINALLNQLVTGDPLLGGYQLADEGRPGTPSHRALHIATLLFVPSGLPSFNDAVEWIDCYWLRMGPLALLVAGQVAMVPLLARRTWRARILVLGALAVVLLLLLSRMYEGFSGATERASRVHHSIPRYWAPIYLFAALPPLLWLGRIRRRALVALGGALALAVAVLGGLELYRWQPTSLTYLESFVRTKTRWLDVAARYIPHDAIVYSQKEDKIVWSRWQVGLIRHRATTAASMQRALAAGRPVFFLESRRGYRPIASALRARNLAIARVHARSGLYQVLDP